MGGIFFLTFGLILDNVQVWGFLQVTKSNL